MIYRFGEVTFDSALYSVQQGEQSIRLRPKVFRTCLYLLEHRDRVVSREELCAQVWGGRFVSQATMEGVIRSVREALGDSGRMQRFIQTSRGYGYRFVAGVEERTPQGVGKEVPQAKTFPRPPESGLPPQVASIIPRAGLAERWEAPSASGQAGEMKGWHPAPAGHAEGDSVTIAREDQHIEQQRRSAIWWFTRGWHAVAVVALVLVGAFGLWWGTSHEALEHLGKSRMAVLPLIDLSAEADQAYLADGIMEDLVAELSQLPGLTVVAHTSVLKYKGSLKDVATIGRELGVNTIVEGSIRKMGNQVRVSVQLIDVASQGHLWSKEYTRELIGIIATQRAIASQLAQGLRVQFTTIPTSIRRESEARNTMLMERVGQGM